VHDLRQPAALPGRARRAALIERDPVRFWQGCACCWLAVLGLAARLLAS
jgi:hypothetical protein